MENMLVIHSMRQFKFLNPGRRYRAHWGTKDSRERELLCTVKNGEDVGEEWLVVDDGGGSVVDWRALEDMGPLIIFD